MKATCFCFTPDSRGSSNTAATGGEALSYSELAVTSLISLLKCDSDCFVSPLPAFVIGPLPDLGKSGKDFMKLHLLHIIIELLCLVWQVNHIHHMTGFKHFQKQSFDV